MQQLSIKEIAQILGCETHLDSTITKVVTDSRQADNCSIFVGIIGENSDGNDYIAAALANGAVACVANRIDGDVDSSKVLLVENTKSALIKIGGLYRDKFNCPLVGVTGSVGKTTTKEFIHTVLSSKFSTHKTLGNQNNELGVPNTLFALEPHHQAGVIEMGMSGLGEIEELTLAVKPSIGVITCIGVSHLEALGSRENILKAKMEITKGMTKGSPLFLCGDDDLLSHVILPDLNIITYGIKSPANLIKASDIVTAEDKTSFKITSPWGIFGGVIPTVGEHNVKNALVAFGVGVTLGVAPEDAMKALGDYVPSGMRQKIVAFDDLTIVEDCYNCSPDSLKAATDALCVYPCRGKRIMVVSDMLELGAIEKDLHFDCGQYMGKKNIDELFGTGELTKNTICGAKTIFSRHFETKDELAIFLKGHIKPKDVVWFKASRGMKLEEVISRIYEG